MDLHLDTVLESESSVDFGSDSDRSDSPPGTPKPMTHNVRVFKLDMTFNRHGPTRDPKRRSACAIDPFVSPPVLQRLQPTPSDLAADASPKEWQSHYRLWSFPTRTDKPRGLTWGPFHEKWEQPSERAYPLSPSSSCGNKRTRNGDLERSVEPKRRKIFPILRPPRNPLIVHLKINPMQPTYAHSLADSVALPPVNHLAVNDMGALVNVIVSPLGQKLPLKSRIVLCSLSQLKYGS